MSHDCGGLIILSQSKKSRAKHKNFPSNSEVPQPHEGCTGKPPQPRVHEAAQKEDNARKNEPIDKNDKMYENVCIKKITDITHIKEIIRQ